MFGPVEPTPYDVRFRLLGIPVTVLPWFWLAGLITGWNEYTGKHLELLAMWIGCLFISILVHEMGHALVARACGWPPQVYLYGFGGLAVYRPTYGRTTLRSVLISLAGPGAGFLLFGLIVAGSIPLLMSPQVQNLSDAAKDRIDFFITQMIFINLWWGLVNLLPVLPLDGGRIAEALLVRFRPWDGPRLAVMLSAIVAGGVAIFFVINRERFQLYPAFLFGLLCYSNIQSLQQDRW